MNLFPRNSSTSSIASSVASDQFKATKMWDDIVQAFCLGIPVSTHRRRLRCYNDCFVAKKAVDWLHHHLNMSPSSSFKNQEVSRDQAVKLLRKFVQHDIIKRVDGSTKSSKCNIQHFEDNKDLYRLCYFNHQESRIRSQVRDHHHHHQDRDQRDDNCDRFSSSSNSGYRNHNNNRIPRLPADQQEDDDDRENLSTTCNFVRSSHFRTSFAERKTKRRPPTKSCRS